MKRMMIKTLVAAAALTAFGMASAQVSERTIKFATQNPKGHPLVMGMEKFAEIVKTKSAARSRSICSPAVCSVVTPPTCRPCRAARWKW